MNTENENLAEDDVNGCQNFEDTPSNNEIDESSTNNTNPNVNRNNGPPAGPGGPPFG